MTPTELYRAMIALGLVVAIDPVLARPFFARAIEERISREAADANGVRQSAAQVGQVQTGGVVIIPLHGVIRPRVSRLAEEYGIGAGLEGFRRKLASAAADPAISAIIVHYETPGGSVQQVHETAEAIRAAASVKPVYAYCDGLCASAGYWLASASTAIWANTSTLIGSIGVVTWHDDISAMLEKAGIKATLVASSAEKVETWPEMPLTAEALAHLQHIVDLENTRFVKAVAKGRSVSVSDVKARFGNGRVLDAADAKAAGMIDEVGTLDALIAKVMKGRAGTGARRAGISMSVRMALAG